MKTQKEVRNAFWRDHHEYECDRRTRKRQNDYNATIRSAFVVWVDSAARDGRISDKMAQEVTL